MSQNQTKFGLAVKEKLARIIAEQFTTNEIVNVFTDANIPTDKSLFAKWRIVVDAFGKMSQPEEGIPHILKAFCHPLNFPEVEVRRSFVKKLNAVLTYEKLEIKATEKGSEMLDEHGFPISPAGEAYVAKTSTDYVMEAINFFKDEYNKVRMAGLTYEYSLGENINSDQVQDGRDGYSERLNAIEQLKNVGFITEYKVEDKVESDGYYVWDYAVCKIDESKLTQKEAPQATAAGAEAIAQKVVHEHTHRFANSIQEKDIALNHNFGDKKPSGFYITKQGDDFHYKGRYINLSKKSDYYKVFASLYALVPEGGEVSYKDLTAEVKNRLRKIEDKPDEEMRKLIQRNLTDRSNGFMRYAAIPETEDNGKPLIEVVRGSGIAFNNKSG